MRRLTRAELLGVGASVVFAGCTGDVGGPVYGAPPGPYEPGASRDAANDLDADAEGGAACYSPTHNVDSVHQPSAIGCPCETTAQDVCVMDSAGASVALSCAFGRWRIVPDAPCE